MAKRWAWIVSGGAVCLLGCGFWFLSRRLSSRSSSSSSEDIQQALNELNLWKRDTETHLETLFDRVKSMAGRMDRARRKAPEEGQEPAEGEPAAAGGEITQSQLYQIAAKKILGAG